MNHTSAVTWRTQGDAGVVLVLVGTLTIMAGATVAPAIPGIRAAFAGVTGADLLAKLITTTHALAIVVFSPVTGAVVGRFGSKRTLLAGLLAFAVGGSSGSYLPDLLSILAGRVVLGIGVALVMSSSMAMIADLYEGGDRRRLLGRQTAASAFGGVVLLLSGGLLVGLDWRMVFLAYLLSAVYLIPAAIFLPDIRPAPARNAETARRAGQRVPGSILAALTAMALGQVAFYAVPVQVPFLVEDHFAAGSLASAAIIAVQTLTTGLVSLRFAFFGRLASKPALVAVSFFGIGLGYIVLFLAPAVAVLAAGMLIMGMALGILMPSLSDWLLAEAPTHLRARYAGYLTTALFFGQFLAPLVTQPIVNTAGIQPTFAALAGGALVIAAAYLVGGRHARR